MTINTTTKNLEGYARKRKMDLMVRQSGGKGNSKACYICIGVDGMHLDQPKIMGMSVRDAEAWIDDRQPKPKKPKDMKGQLCITRGCKGRFALKKEDHQYVQCPECFFNLPRLQESGQILLAQILSSQ